MKNAPRAAWFVAGVCVAALLVPTTVGAVAALKYTGIEGLSTNKADVTPNSQLLTTEANPASYFTGSQLADTGGGTAVVYAALGGVAGIVKSIQVDVWDLTGSDPYVYLAVGNQSCSGLLVFIQEVDPATNGTTVLPQDPGLVVPAGDAICASANQLDSDVHVTGYTIAGASAPTLPLSTVKPPSKT
jgi:hypothetical protein